MSYNGEWIIKIPDLVDEDDAVNADARIRSCLSTLGLLGVEILFDESRWTKNEECPYTFSHTRHWCGYKGCRDS